MATLDLALIQHRRDTAANWVVANPVLASGEKGIETDTHLEKLGDGVTLWNSLGYMPEQLAKQITSATSKTTPVDADEIPLADSAASFGLKKLTWANIKVTIFTAIGALTGKTTPVDADTFAISDSAASGVGKSLTWANVKATLKTYFDTLYEATGLSILKSLLTTTGDIIYASAASTAARLGIGTTGQVLTVAGGLPSWATPAGGGGKVLQIVQGVISTATTNATGGYVNTGLTATITPSASTSRILVLVNQGGFNKGTNVANDSISLILMRATTQIQLIGLNIGYTNSVAVTRDWVSASYLDSPATVAATTYKTQFRNNGSSTATVQADTETSTITLIEIGA